MSFFLNLNYSHTLCPNGCKLFNDNKNYSYWEKKEVTSDEKDILIFINKKQNFLNNKILHVGVGSSYLAKNLNKNFLIEGISISNNEIQNANKLKKDNYNCYFQNKYSNENILDSKKNLFSIIIDVNLKSYSCCDVAFNKLIERYKRILLSGGMIITSKAGMNWSRIVKPVLSFSFKKFIYRRLKEFDGPLRNILNLDDISKIAINNDFSLENIDNKIIILKKINEKNSNF